MKENTVVAFRNPSDFQEDPLTEVLQAGAHKLLAQAIEAEVASFLAPALKVFCICRRTPGP